MFQSVKERRKNAPFFYKCYSDVCMARNVAPISFAKCHAEKNILDIFVDRMAIDEWLPVLEALKSDRSLCLIAFRSKHLVKKVLEDVDTEAKTRLVKKYPVLYTRFVLRLLMISLAECIAESLIVTCLELEGLPLKPEYMTILSKGILTNASLQTVSFHGSSLGDEACKQLISLVRNKPVIFHLDLSSCNLSSRSAVEVAETLKYQSLQHYTEGWKQSLRNHDPNLESMPGLRRIILNDNPQIGDEGIKRLAEVLKEDIWLKAIDLQNCGISKVGAQCVLDMLDINVTLYIVDVRDNKGIDDVLVHQIMLKLLYNNANKDAREYRWTVPQSQHTCVNTSKSLIPSSGLRHISMKCTSQSAKEKQKLKELVEHLEIETSLRKKAELEQEELRSKINELENELLKEKEEKDGYCFVKMEAYESIMETLRKFSIFVEHIKEANEINNQEIYLQDNHNRMVCANEMKNLLEAHVKNIIKVTTQEEQNKLCTYLQKCPQEMATSFKRTENVSQNNNFNIWKKRLQEDTSHVIERNDRIVTHIPKDFTSKFEMKHEPITTICSCPSSVVHDDTKVLDSGVPVVLNNSSNSSLSKIRKLYEQFIEHNANK